MKASAFRDFIDFLKGYNVVALSIAFVMGSATDTLVKSTVNNIVMPLIQPLLVAKRWEEAVWHVGPFNFGIGIFFADLLRFIALAVLIYVVVRKILKFDQVPKRK